MILRNSGKSISNCFKIIINIFYKLWYGLASSLWGIEFFYIKLIATCKGVSVC